MSATLSHACNTVNWGNDAGTMVCRIYKALFTFALTGLYAFSPSVSHSRFLEFPPWPVKSCKSLADQVLNMNSVSTLSALTLDVIVRRKQTQRGTYNAMQDLKTAANDPIDPYQQNVDFHDASSAFRAQRTPKAPERAGYALPEEQTRYGAETAYHHGYAADEH